MIEIGHIYLYGFAAIVFALAMWWGERVDRKEREKAKRERRVRLMRAAIKFVEESKGIVVKK